MTEQEREFLRSHIIWSGGLAVLEEPEYHLQAKPQKELLKSLALYSPIPLYLAYTYSLNPEKFYQGLLVARKGQIFSFMYFLALPSWIALRFFRRRAEVKKQVNEATFKGFSDDRLIDLFVRMKI